MHSIKLIILTIALAIVFPIQLIGQITLSNSQFDFYAKALVNEKVLKVDTTVLRSQLKDCEEIVMLQKDQVDGVKFALKAQSDITDNYRTSLSNLQKKYDKKVKWIKIAKKVIVAVVVIVVAETVIIYIILTH